MRTGHRAPLVASIVVLLASIGVTIHAVRTDALNAVHDRLPMTVIGATLLHRAAPEPTPKMPVVGAEEISPAPAGPPARSGRTPERPQADAATQPPRSTHGESGSSTRGAESVPAAGLGATSGPGRGHAPGHGASQPGRAPDHASAPTSHHGRPVRPITTPQVRPGPAPGSTRPPVTGAPDRGRGSEPITETDDEDIPEPVWGQGPDHGRPLGERADRRGHAGVAHGRGPSAVRPDRGYRGHRGDRGARGDRGFGMGKAGLRGHHAGPGRR